MRRPMDYFETYEIEDLKDMLIKTTEKNGNRVAFKVKEHTGIIKDKSYTDFKADVIALSTKLMKMGYSNKRIAIMGINSYGWAVSYLAATIIGIVVPIDKESSMDNVKEFLNTSKAEAIIADSKFLDKIVELKKLLT